MGDIIRVDTEFVFCLSFGDEMELKDFGLMLLGLVAVLFLLWVIGKIGNALDPKTIEALERKNLERQEKQKQVASAPKKLSYWEKRRLKNEKSYKEMMDLEEELWWWDESEDYLPGEAPWDHPEH